MDEKRLQKYLELVEKLLSCSTEEEINQILVENKNLLDVGFLRTIVTEAEKASNEGDERTAKRLRYSANARDKALNSSSSVSKASPTIDIKQSLEFLSEEEIQVYLQFLLQVLKATYESEGDAQVVYPLLAANIDKLDANLADILWRWATSIFDNVEALKAKSIATAICGFCDLIIQFSLGHRASNIEIAITGWEVILTFFTKGAYSTIWAMVQNDLGIVYRERTKGNKEENIENAITCLKAALEVYTQNDFPYDWAMVQNNLGAAYRERIKENKEENLENAIVYFKAALEVYTQNDFSYEFATTQNNLGVTYDERIKGDKADNIENAIVYFKAALEVYTQNDFPYDWAVVQHNLGSAYRKRIIGDKADNIEKATVYYKAALIIRTRNNFPYEFAMTQNNLGVTYDERIKGNKADNIEKAIVYYKTALIIRTRNDLPYDWATTQNNLGNAYSERIKGNEEENIENAIACFNAALEITTRNKLPYEWAETQSNLGSTYSRRIKGNKEENIENGIACLKEALEVYTRNNFPQNWAMVKNNLGAAYRERIKGNKEENIENAIACLKAALKVYTRNDFPGYNANTLFALGLAYQDVKRFKEAYTTFEHAIETIESLRNEIVSGDETKRKQAEEWKKLYLNMVEVCLELKEDTQAIEYVERSKTRNLVELILERDRETIFPPEVATQLEQLRDEIATGQYQIQNGKAENPQVLGRHLKQLRKQRNELQDRHLSVGYSFKFNPFQGSLDERTAIIEWYILNDKILAFIIKPTGEITIWQSEPEDEEAFGNWVNQYLQNYYNQKDQWQNSLEEELKKLASILHIDEILSHIPKQCHRLILIPYLFLHLLPLHALPVTTQDSENPSCLLDLFPGGVSYAPSCQILQQVQQRQRNDFQSLFAIQNPTGDLIYTNLEVEIIQSYFTNPNVLKQAAATLTAVNNSNLNTYHCTHFSCHGAFNLKNPGKSALILANAPTANPPQNPDTERYLSLRSGETDDLEECLTLNKIFTLKLEKCRLVTLSACETGLIDFRNTSDEYIGLPSGFLLAGSPSVVSSLWKVNDVSTSLLMIKFYENLFKLDNLEAGDIAVALQQAQKWLRNLTIEEFEKFLEEHKPQIEKVLAQLRPGQRIIFKESLKRIKKRQSLPFANPYYWAGFTASGY